MSPGPLILERSQPGLPDGGVQDLLIKEAKRRRRRRRLFVAAVLVVLVSLAGFGLPRLTGGSAHHPGTRREAPRPPIRSAVAPTTCSPAQLQASVAFNQ